MWWHVRIDTITQNTPPWYVHSNTPLYCTGHPSTIALCEIHMSQEFKVKVKSYQSWNSMPFISNEMEETLLSSNFWNNGFIWYLSKEKVNIIIKQFLQSSRIMASFHVHPKKRQKYYYRAISEIVRDKGFFWYGRWYLWQSYQIISISTIIVLSSYYVNSLTPGRFQWNFV